MTGPTAAIGSFPYPHRNCAEWGDISPARSPVGCEQRTGSFPVAARSVPVANGAEGQLPWHGGTVSQRVGAPRWCDQCDRRVHASEVDRCISAFCKAQPRENRACGLTDTDAVPFHAAPSATEGQRKHG